MKKYLKIYKKCCSIFLRLSEGGLVMKKEFYKGASFLTNEKDCNLSKDNFKKGWRKPNITEVDYSLTNATGGEGGDFSAEEESS